MEYIIGLMGISYGIMTFTFWWIWKQMPSYQVDSVVPSEMASVIICCRDEAANLPLLFQALAAQDARNFEVIFIDDSSTDNSKELIASFAKTAAFPVSTLSLQPDPKRISHKKAAITLGISQAKGKVILTTDADCYPEPQWIKTTLRFMEETRALFVSGPVCFHHESTLFQKMQTIEHLSLIGAGATSMALGKPNMCNGANIAYTQEVFHEVGGFTGNEALASGDDEFLMHKIAAAHPDNVRYLKSHEATVWTHPQETLHAFIQQRIRWASKWDSYDNPAAIALAIYIYAYHFMVYALPFYVLLFIPSPQTLWAIASFYALKICSESFYLSSMLSYFGKQTQIKLIPLVQLWHSFYILTIGALGKLKGYTWKGRTFN